MHVCPICFNTPETQPYHFTERMFGMGGDFTYLKCSVCQTLYIDTIPEDLGTYYPTNYYSFNFSEKQEQIGLAKKKLQMKFKDVRNQIILRNFLGLGDTVHRYWPEPIYRSLRYLRVKKDMRILDVGCGDGRQLRSMHRLGFTSLLGIDPFVRQDYTYPDGVRVLKQDVWQTTGQYDLIMLHHAFEHMPEPLAILKRLKELLAPSGVLLIRIPVSDSNAYARYGSSWVQADAPRHLFLATRKALARGAEAAGLVVDKIIDDGTAFQFWGSELYQKGVPLFDTKGHPTPISNYFTPTQLRNFTAEADALNKAGKADQICAYVRHA